MPRPSKRPLRPQHRVEQALGILRSWRKGDTVASVAARLNIPEHRVKEALLPVFAAVRMRKGKGMTADVIAEETGLPREFVGHAMRENFGMRDARRDREGPEVLKAAKRYRREGLTKREALREAKAAHGWRSEGRA